MVLLEATLVAAGTGGGAGLIAGAIGGGAFGCCARASVNNAIDDAARIEGLRDRRRSSLHTTSTHLVSPSAADTDVTSPGPPSSGSPKGRTRSSSIASRRRGFKSRLTLEPADAAAQRHLARLLAADYYASRGCTHCTQGAAAGAVCGLVCAPVAPLCAAPFAVQGATATQLGAWQGAALGGAAGCGCGTAAAAASEGTNDDLVHYAETLSVRQQRELQRALGSALADDGLPDKAREVKSWNLADETEVEQWRQLLSAALANLGRGVALHISRAGKGALGGAPRALFGTSGETVAGAAPVPYHRRHEARIVPWTLPDPGPSRAAVAEGLRALLPPGDFPGLARCDERCPGEWIVPVGVRAPGETEGTPPSLYVLYFHGGAYVFGSCQTARRITVPLSVEARACILSVSYRLAPQHRWPAQLVDGLAAYKWLLSVAGCAPVAVGGDSAGGHLAVSTVLAAHRTEMPFPKCVVLLSPWLDFSPRGPVPPPSDDASTAREGELEDMLLPMGRVEEIISCVLSGEGSVSSPPGLRLHPLVSPARMDRPTAAEWGMASPALPRFWVSAGDREALLADSEAFISLLPTGHSFPAPDGIELGIGMPHVWQLLSDKVPQGRQSLSRIALWLQAHTEPEMEGRETTVAG